MTEREPKEIIQALINEYKTYKKASFLIIPILAIAAAATFFNRVLSLVLLAAAVIYQIFYLRKKQKTILRPSRGKTCFLRRQRNCILMHRFPKAAVRLRRQRFMRQSSLHSLTIKQSPILHKA
ncbi:MAG: hypothetical protein ACLVLA_09380 [Acidaminococcus intestini]